MDSASGGTVRPLIVPRIRGLTAPRSPGIELPRIGRGAGPL